MNAFTARLWDRSVRYLRLHSAHLTGRPRGIRPNLEDLEERVVPAGGSANTLNDHLAAAAQVAHPVPGSGQSVDRLDEFWSATNSGSQTGQSKSQWATHVTAGVISAFT